MRVLAIVCVVVAWSSVAQAQPAGAQAEVLFREGRDLMQKGKYAEACSAFEQSQKLEPAPTTLLNLAGCREKVGQLATAWGLFLEAERKTRSATDATTKQLYEVAKSKAAKLEPRISKLTIAVAPGSEGVEVKRGEDRVESAMWGRALPIDGGTYTITASAPGKKPWSAQITIANEKDAKTVDVPVLEEADAVVTSTTPAPTTRVETPTASRSKLPYLVGAGGVLLLGGALGLSFWGDASYEDAKAETMSQQRRDERYNSANKKRYAAQGVGVAGVALVGVAVWLFVSGRSDDESPPRTSRVLTVTSEGVAFGGTF